MKKKEVLSISEFKSQKYIANIYLIDIYKALFQFLKIGNKNKFGRRFHPLEN